MIHDHSPPALAKEHNHSCSLLRPQPQCWQHGWIRTEQLEAGVQTWKKDPPNDQDQDVQPIPAKNPGMSIMWGKSLQSWNMLDMKVLRILQPSHTITIVVANGEFCWTNHRLALTFLAHKRCNAWRIALRFSAKCFHCFRFRHLSWFYMQMHHLYWSV